MPGAFEANHGTKCCPSGPGTTTMGNIMDPYGPPPGKSEFLLIPGGEKKKHFEMFEFHNHESHHLKFWCSLCPPLEFAPLKKFKQIT